jgi:hypothetical protein
VLARRLLTKSRDAGSVVTGGNGLQSRVRHDFGASRNPWVPAHRTGRAHGRPPPSSPKGSA